MRDGKRGIARPPPIRISSTRKFQLPSLNVKGCTPVTDRLELIHPQSSLEQGLRGDLCSVVVVVAAPANCSEKTRHAWRNNQNVRRGGLCVIMRGRLGAAGHSLSCPTAAGGLEDLRLGPSQVEGSRASQIGPSEHAPEAARQIVSEARNRERAKVGEAHKGGCLCFRLRRRFRVG